MWVPIFSRRYEWRDKLCNVRKRVWKFHFDTHGYGIKLIQENKQFMFSWLFVIVNEKDGIEMCKMHNEKKFVLAKEIKIAKIPSACWLSLIYDGKVLTKGAIILSK